MHFHSSNKNLKKNLQVLWALNGKVLITERKKDSEIGNWKRFFVVATNLLQSLAFILTESHQPAVAAAVTFARIWGRLLPKI